MTASQNMIPESIAVGALPAGVRAYLVTQSAEGQQTVPVPNNCSVLNIESELLKHLDSQPYPDAFLEGLRDYCAARLGNRAQARADSKAQGGVPCNLPGQAGERAEVARAAGGELEQTATALLGLVDSDNGPAMVLIRRVKTLGCVVMSAMGDEGETPESLRAWMDGE